MSTHGQQIEHTPEQNNIARQQISILSGANMTGIRLDRADIDRIVHESTRRMFISGPSRDVITARVTHLFADALRARGDQTSIDMADRLERLRAQKISSTETPHTTNNAPVTAITPQVEQSIRQLAQAYNVNPDYLVREVRSAQVRVSRDSSGNTSVAVQSSYVNPTASDQHMRSVANNLAASILFSVYGSHQPYTNGAPNYSNDNLIAGAAHFSNVDAPAQINDRTTNRWITNQATRLHMDRDTLERVLTTYATIYQGSPEMAAQYLGRNSDNLTANAMELIRIAGPRLNSGTVGDGPVTFNLQASDTLRISNEVARNDRLNRIV